MSLVERAACLHTQNLPLSPISKKTKRGVTYFAVAKAPGGNDAYRIVGKDFYKEFK